mmetsp:Transcript_10397/g.26170  ORF Transcript_10397/g.26170 Transcript_10397/m.26170 type:complete len:225 (+) Transcript_10397:839-1513(+)
MATASGPSARSALPPSSAPEARGGSRSPAMSPSCRLPHQSVICVLSSERSCALGPRASETSAPLEASSSTLSSSSEAHRPGGSETSSATFMACTSSQADSRRKLSSEALSRSAGASESTPSSESELGVRSSTARVPRRGSAAPLRTPASAARRAIFPAHLGIRVSARSASAIGNAQSSSKLNEPRRRQASLATDGSAAARARMPRTPAACARRSSVESEGIPLR